MINSKWKITLALILTTVLLYIPYVSLFVRALNTMFHESGHAIAALITDGKVHSISLFSNTSGVAMTSSTGWLSSIFISLAGYVFTSLVVLTMCYFWKKSKSTWILYSFLAFNLVNAIFWVRNIYGIFWLIGFSLLIIGLLKVKKESIVSMSTLILTLVVLTDSLRSSATILYLSLNAPGNAGDVSNLVELTLIPGPVWGSIFLIQALVFSFISLSLLWKNKKSFV